MSRLMPVSSASHCCVECGGHAAAVRAPAWPAHSTWAAMSRRRSLTARDSSSLRAGASPSQNGIVGGAPLASATRTTPLPTCMICHEALPSWKMSPALLSMAKSSLSVPTTVSSGTLNEDFAIESNAGDIFQLGNASWQIMQVGSGVVRVADAKGAPPTIPFWLGEAPARSDELSRAVSDLRDLATTPEWLVEETGMNND